MWGKPKKSDGTNDEARPAGFNSAFDANHGRIRSEREEFDLFLEKSRREAAAQENDQQETAPGEEPANTNGTAPEQAADWKLNAAAPDAKRPAETKGQSAHKEWGESMSNSDSDMASETGSPGPQFYAGPGLKLKGEITGCDTFKVEGEVEGKVNAQHLHLSPTGSFNGTADVQDAAIEGKFEGTLNVAGCLLIRSSGKVSGKVVYGQIEIERGGEILGEVSPRKDDAQMDSGPRRRTPSLVTQNYSSTANGAATPAE